MDPAFLVAGTAMAAPMVMAGWYAKNAGRPGAQPRRLLSIAFLRHTQT
jgi:hypothetical protein